MIEIIKDIWASLVRGVNDRGTNPLTFAFILSWAGWNLKFLIVIWGNSSSSEKILAIEAMYPGGWDVMWGQGFLYPALTSLMYVFVYPFVSEAAIRFYRWRQVSISNKIRRIEAERLLSREDVARITSRHEKERRDWTTQSEEQERIISELRDALRVKENSYRSLSETSSYERKNAAARKPIVDAQVSSGDGVTPKEEGASGAELSSNLSTKLVVELSDLPDGATAQELSSLFGVNYSVIRYCLEELEVAGTVSIDSDERWSLTSKGRGAAVRLLAEAGLIKRD